MILLSVDIYGLLNFIIWTSSNRFESKWTISKIWKSLWPFVRRFFKINKKVLVILHKFHLLAINFITLFKNNIWTKLQWVKLDPYTGENTVWLCSMYFRFKLHTNKITHETDEICNEKEANLKFENFEILNLRTNRHTFTGHTIR